MLVIAIPDTLHAHQMIKTARTLNPKIEIILRADSADEMQLLQQESSDLVFLAEDELAKGMTNHVLTRISAQAEQTVKAH
jgi:CPA2 family monovalent cation:H+ antiporter-2